MLNIWEIHITQLCNSLARYVSIFYKIRNLVPVKLKKQTNKQNKTKQKTSTKNSYTIHLYILELHME